MGALMRKFQWENTVLGAPRTWPQSLKTAVRIVLTSQQPMFVWWGDSLVNIYNDPYRGILGGKHPKALGQPASVVWREIWQQVGPRAQAAIARNQGTYDEALFLMMERNGYPEETYYTFSYSPIPDDNGEACGIFCANTDETQRIITARRLATQRELAARSTDALTVADACTGTVSALATNQYDLPFAVLFLRQNGAYQSICHKEAGDQPFQDPKSWPLDEVLKSAKPKTIDLPWGVAFPTGAWTHPPKQAAMLPINPSSQMGYSAVLVAGLNPHCAYDQRHQDFLTLIASQTASALTSAKAYEEERKRAESLEELDRAKTTFFANISHEFRTPLTLMLGPVETLLAQCEDGGNSLDRPALESVHRNAVRLQKLVNALLDFSRIEAGRMSAKLQPTNLAAYTSELASSFESAMKRAQLKFTVECEALSSLMAVDRDMWEKIVLNLLSNALKYTLKGEVALRLFESAGYVKLSVSDTGIGIPKTELPRLFERFHRVAGAQGRTYEGTGIGLALVHELARLHGGNVTVSSELGRGSVFTVTMPRSPTSPKTDATESSVANAHSLQANAYVEEALGWLPPDGQADLPLDLSHRASSPRNGRILLADDNADMRAYLQRLLSAEFDVIVASNGRQALDLAIAQVPDLILSDIMMPELDGMGLLKELRANPATRSIPFVFLSARAGEEASAEGREAGADDYIVKPFTARELIARVRGTLLLHRERRHSIEQLNQVLEQAPVPICVLQKPDFVYELANPSYLELVGRKQIVGLKISDVLPDLPEGVGKAFHNVVNNGDSFVANEWCVPFDANGDGQAEDHWFNVAYNPLRNSDDTIRGLVAVIHDVTKQVLSRKEVERVNRELEEFAFVASHDLQEPLRTVNAYSQLLVQRLGTATPDQSQKYVEFICKGVRRMEELIRDLLTFARTVQSNDLETEPVPLKASLDKALDTLRAQIDEKAAVIEVGELPIVMADDTQLPALFQNLVSNALKYSKSNAPLKIQVSATRSGKEWTISVRDNGIGFKQDYASHIFGLFKRLHKDEYPGTGLGLAICKRIVERFGGRIWADSSPGQGSTFFFTLQGAE